MKSILITGGCGFIGMTLVTMLRDRGHRVSVFDNMSRPCDAARSRLPAPWGEGVDLAQGDIRDTEALRRVMRGHNTVIHLAAFGSVAESVEDPNENFSVNVSGTLSVLQACVAEDVHRLIFASTGGALIGNAPPPVNEASLPWPISPYGAGKLCCEAYLHAFQGSYGLETIALRFANVYGPHSWHKKGAVTAFIKNVLASRPLIIYGDGSASRDFLFVDDLCEGIVASLEAELSDEVIHLASGVETSIGELAALVLDLMDRSDIPISHRAGRRGEVGRNFATAEKARGTLDFVPRVDLRTGLQHTISWYQSVASAPES